jgi:hypothetical protein
MKIKMPRSFFDQNNKRAAASERKVAFPKLAEEIMAHNGHPVVSRLSFSGGYATIFDYEGDAIRIGLKTAVNRWLNNSSTLVEATDKVLLTTVQRDESGKPVSLEMWLVDSEKLLAIISAVRKEGLERGVDPHHFYTPLDEEEMASGHAGCVAGPISAIVEKKFGPYEIIWTDEDEAEIATDVALTLRRTDTGQINISAILERARREIAEEAGMPEDNVELRLMMTA